MEDMFNWFDPTSDSLPDLIGEEVSPDMAHLYPKEEKVALRSVLDRLMANTPPKKAIIREIMRRVDSAILAGDREQFCCLCRYYKFIIVEWL